MPNMVEPKPESVNHCMIRKSKNAWTRMKGYAKSSKVQASISVKKVEINKIKKQFGIQFCDLVRAEAPEEAVLACVLSTQSDLDKLENDIDHLKTTAARIDEKTRRKLKKKPSNWTMPGAHTQVAPDLHVATVSKERETSSAEEDISDVPVTASFVVYDSPTSLVKTNA
jgi:hypothetical protein